MLDVCDEYNCIGMEMPLLLCRRRLSPTLIDVMAAEWVRCEPPQRFNTLCSGVQ